MQSSDNPSWTPLPTPTIAAGPSSSVPNASSSASAGSRPGRNAPRRRYPQEVYDFLTHYYDTVNQYPTKSERVILVERVKRIPGCEDYTMEKLYHYFAGKRQSDTRKTPRTSNQTPTQPAVQPPTQLRSMPHPQAKNPLINTAHILYPSLTKDPSILPKLDVLFDETPLPTSDVAKIWAARLGSEVLLADVMTYGQLKLARRHRGEPPVLHSQLPTPESSISPEPLSTPTSPVIETSWGKREPEDEVKDELESEDDEDSDVKTEFDAQDEGAHDPRVMFIADQLGKALMGPPASPSERVRPPKTFKDLSRWFKEQYSFTLDGPGKAPPREAPAPTPDRRQSYPMGGRTHG